jgi:hypothetical protein
VRRRGPDVDDIGVADAVAEDAAVADEPALTAREYDGIRLLVRDPVLLRGTPVVERVGDERGLQRCPVDVGCAVGELDA